MFEVEVTYSLESDRDHTLEVRGKAQPFFPAITSGPPDNWAPAEGGELEDLEIYAVYGRRRKRLPRKLEDRIADDERFIEKVYAALER